MDRYALLNTKYINDDCSLRRTYIQTPSIYYGNAAPSDIYKKRFTFHIPTDYDGLYSMSIKCTLSTAGNNHNANILFGTKIFKYIELRTRRGIVLGKLFPDYLYSKIDQLRGTLLGSNLEYAVNTDNIFDNTTVTVWVPLLFWFSEDISLKLRTRHIEELELYCEVADTKEDMGLAAELTAASYELHMDFLEKRKEEPFTGGTTYGYDVYMEKQQTVANGTTSTVMELSCPYPIFTTTFKLTGANANDMMVNKFEIKTMGRIWKTKYRKNVYDMTGTSNLNNFYMSDGSPLTYKHTNIIDRVDCRKMKDFISFSDSMKPTYCTVEHVDPGVVDGATLSIFHEYLQERTISDKGMFDVPAMGLFDKNRN